MVVERDYKPGNKAVYIDHSEKYLVRVLANYSDYLNYSYRLKILEVLMTGFENPLAGGLDFDVRMSRCGAVNPWDLVNPR